MSGDSKSKKSKDTQIATNGAFFDKERQIFSEIPADTRVYFIG